MELIREYNDSAETSTISRGQGEFRVHAFLHIDQFYLLSKGKIWRGQVVCLWVRYKLGNARVKNISQKQCNCFILPTIESQHHFNKCMCFVQNVCVYGTKLQSFKGCTWKEFNPFFCVSHPLTSVNLKNYNRFLFILLEKIISCKNILLLLISVVFSSLFTTNYFILWIIHMTVLWVRQIIVN